MKRLLFTLLVCALAVGLGIQRAKATCNNITGNGNEDFSCKKIAACGLLSMCILDECYEPNGYACEPKSLQQCNLTGCAFTMCPNNCSPIQTRARLDDIKR